MTVNEYGVIEDVELTALKKKRAEAVERWNHYESEPYRLSFKIERLHGRMEGLLRSLEMCVEEIKDAEEEALAKHYERI
jgi:hypothetical protein